MYTSKTPEYIIDLSEDESSRWDEVIRRDKVVARRVARQALQLLEKPAWFVSLFGKAMGSLYGLYGGHYQGEIEAWADALKVSPGVATMLNCSYELSYLENPLACTAGVRWVKGLGMIHLRNMDWPLPAIGDATRIFRFQRGRHEFVSVGITGFVGVLSGMVPGAYSVTINQAPSQGRPGFDFGPAFLLRNVLEDCARYDEAVAYLSDTKLSAPVFFTVCGTKQGQACVIERTRDDAVVRKMRGDVLVQANHHVARKFLGNNASIEEEDEEGATVMAHSQERYDTMTEELTKVKTSDSLDEVARVLDVEPVLNDDSYQQMAFCPASGEVRVWRWLSRRSA